MTETAAAFWQRYVGTLPVEHPHRQARPDAFAFGDSPALANQLAALVRAGRKRATASLPVEFTSAGLSLPAAGDISIVTLADDTPVAIIELVEVRHVPFQAVDAAFAADEGEGDGSLAWWQAAHRRYFGRVCAKLGGQLDETTPVICQRFRLVWSSDAARAFFIIGTLQLANGRSFRWRGGATGGGSSAFFANGGALLVRFAAGSIFDRVNTYVDVQPEASAVPECQLLIALGLYLRLAMGKESR